MDDLIQDIKMHVYDSGSIADSEVGLLQNFITRYGVTEPTCRLLLDLNNVLSGTHSASFDALFLETLKTFMLDASGVVTETQWEWLSDQILKDGKIDPLEQDLINALASVATSLPPAMQAQVTK